MTLLEKIYKPIKKDLSAVDNILFKSLKNTKYKAILNLSNYLLEAKGKRIRPALVILSAKAVTRPTLSRGYPESPVISQQLIKTAAAIELIHIASLVHDDIIDEAALRHYRASFNAKFGKDISIAFGDYLYAIAFELISSCKNTAILSCIASSGRSLCEGELIQLSQREKPSLLKKHYLFIAEKKTASLFSASSQAGAILAGANYPVQKALKDYGLNLGIAFQIIDDCLDLISSNDKLGKPSGLDLKAGELTLPILNLISRNPKAKAIVEELLKRKNKKEGHCDLGCEFINSPAFKKTKKDAGLYIQRAVECLNNLKESVYKHSLSILLDYVAVKLD